MRRPQKTAPRTAYSRFSEPLRRCVLIALLVSLPLCGLAGSLSSLLGLNHHHRQVEGNVAALDAWQDFRRENVGGVAPLPHDHSLWQRHHHDQGDPTVVALDGPEHDASPGDIPSNASVEMMCAVWNAFDIPESVDAARCWPRDPSGRLATVFPVPFERPPKA